MKTYSTNPLNLDQSPTALLNHIREELDALFRENKIPLSATISCEPWVLSDDLTYPTPPPVTRFCLVVGDSAGGEVHSWPGGVDVPSTDNAA